MIAVIFLRLSLIFKEIIKWVWRLPRSIACILIKLYQKTLSPDHGPLKRFFKYGYCRYKPTCSSYCHESIKDDGLIIGSGKCAWRILRCNPWSEGGYDPVHKCKHGDCHENGVENSLDDGPKNIDKTNLK
jgi:uncharacterized protein